MRLAMEYFKRGITVHHGKVRTRLISIRSLLHYLSFQVYDRGITLTPSYVRKDEVLNYLIGSYDSEELEPLKSHSLGTYEVDNYLMLGFASKVTTNEYLANDLDLLSFYYKTRETEKNISLYLNKKRKTRGVTTVKPFAKFEFGRIKFRSYNDLAYHDNYYTVGNAKEVHISHIFYDALADYASMPRNNDWTFRKELTREEESKYIVLILDGSIKPNTEIGKKVYKAYMHVVATKTPNLIYEETFLRRMEEIDSLAERILNEGKQLKGVTDYSIIYEDNLEEITHFPVHASYYAWDHDYDLPLDEVNRLRGIGGEFTRREDPNSLPYEVYVNGKIVEMYRVELDIDQSGSSYLLNSLEEEFADVEGVNVEINSVDTDEYRITMENLSPSGFAYVEDEMDDYIRALNATDLELSGDATVFMTNMFPKLNYKSQLRSITRYLQLREGEGDMELKVKTVIDESDEMYIKLHLKYYNPSQNGEQVVEGLLTLNENLKITDLYTLISDNLVVELNEDHLDSKRVGVYSKESESVYAYKFLMLFNPETKSVQRLQDSILGLDRKGKVLNSLNLTMLGLNQEQESVLQQMVRDEIKEIILQHSDKNSCFREMLNSNNMIEA